MGYHRPAANPNVQRETTVGMSIKCHQSYIRAEARQEKINGSRIEAEKSKKVARYTNSQRQNSLYNEDQVLPIAQKEETRISSGEESLDCRPTVAESLRPA